MCIGLLEPFPDPSKKQGMSSGHPFIKTKRSRVYPQLDIIETSEALGAVYYTGGCSLVMQRYFINNRIVMEEGVTL